MGLKFKILSGFGILAFMLLIAGVWSIIELRSIGKTVTDILDENYKSIYAAKSMKEALEREDSAILLLLLGKKVDAVNILNSADSLFNSAFNTAKANITLEGETQAVDSISILYSKFSSGWNSLLNDYDINVSDIDLYMNDLHKLFLSVRKAADRLIDMNDKEMYRLGKETENRSRRAIMPGIIAIISAIIFTLLFNYFVNKYMINPIIEITERINKFTTKRINFDYHADTKDEISKLADSVTILAAHVNTDEKR
ncbi:MAG: MCP four helix bundle domain-containing protein [Bacteroidetes bacterium]|nr:MCP four helix bundle domain-containing protein [Bacteroidota bacterium]